jgi:hypothetical protein
MVLAAAGGCASVPFEGLYCPAAGSKTYPSSCQYVVETKDGVWVANQHGARLARRDRLALHAPKDAEHPWQLEDGQPFIQVVDPFFALAIRRLKGRHTFVKVQGGWQFDEELMVWREPLVIEDGLWLRSDGFKEHGQAYACHAGIFVADPTMSGVNGVEMTVAPPPTGYRTSRYGLLAEPPHDEAHCSQAPARSSPGVAYTFTETVRLFLGPDGDVEGLEVSDVGLYVPQGTSQRALNSLVEYWHLDDRPPDG